MVGNYMISITKDTIDQTKIFDQIKDDSCGAIVSFIGFVRDHSSKGKVEGIFYEAYDEMLEEILKKIEREVFKNWNIKKYIAVHRTGYLHVGEISVVLAQVLVGFSQSAHFQTGQTYGSTARYLSPNSRAVESPERYAELSKCRKLASVVPCNILD